MIEVIDMVYPMVFDRARFIVPFDRHIADAGCNNDSPVTFEDEIKEEGVKIPMLYRITATMTIIKMAQP